MLSNVFILILVLPLSYWAFRFYRYGCLAGTAVTLLPPTACWHIQDSQKLTHLVRKHKTYCTKWFKYWKEEDLNFVLTMPNLLPAMRHRDSCQLWKACRYL
jgi:hypothetical protein